MASDWKNPILKVKGPKVVLDPFEPIAMEDDRVLINTCQRGDFIGERDGAIFLFLLDTGTRVVQPKYYGNNQSFMVSGTERSGISR